MVRGQFDQVAIRITTINGGNFSTGSLFHYRSTFNLYVMMCQMLYNIICRQTDEETQVCCSLNGASRCKPVFLRCPLLPQIYFLITKEKYIFSYSAFS